MDIRKPEWFEHQPFGQMPYLVDTETGLEVFESRAIIRCEWESSISRALLVSGLCYCFPMG